MLSSSWIMRAVASQMISPETSKNQTGKEWSSEPRMTRWGMLQCSHFPKVAPVALGVSGPYPLLTNFLRRGVPP